MSLIEALLSPAVAAAVATHLGLLAVLIAVTLWLEPRVREVGPSHWLLEHMGYPAGRALVIVSFVLVAYPTLFGLESAPALEYLLQAKNGRFQSLINWVFLVSLLLPLLPVIGAMQALILPVQGMVATALLFHWFAQATDSGPVSYWPGWEGMFVIVILAVASHWLAQTLSRTVGTLVNERLNLSDGEDLVFEVIVLLCQIPVLLVYGLALGKTVSA